MLDPSPYELGMFRSSCVTCQSPPGNPDKSVHGAPSSDFGSSSSIALSPPAYSPAFTSALLSFGRLKLVLLLDATLPDRPDEFFPTLDIDARRDEGPEAIPLVGEAERAPPSSRFGISKRTSGVSLQLFPSWR